MVARDGCVPRHPAPRYAPLVVIPAPVTVSRGIPPADDWPSPASPGRRKAGRGALSESGDACEGRRYAESTVRRVLVLTGKAIGVREADSDRARLQDGKTG